MEKKPKGLQTPPEQKKRKKRDCRTVLVWPNNTQTLTSELDSTCYRELQPKFSETHWETPKFEKNRMRTENCCSAGPPRCPFQPLTQKEDGHDASSAPCWRERENSTISLPKSSSNRKWFVRHHAHIIAVKVSFPPRRTSSYFLSVVSQQLDLCSSANDPPVFNHVQNLFRFTDSDRNRHQDTSAGRGQVLRLWEEL